MDTPTRGQRPAHSGQTSLPDTDSMGFSCVMRHSLPSDFFQLTVCEPHGRPEHAGPAGEGLRMAEPYGSETPAAGVWGLHSWFACWSHHVLSE